MRRSGTSDFPEDTDLAYFREQTLPIKSSVDYEFPIPRTPQTWHGGLCSPATILYHLAPPNAIVSDIFFCQIMGGKQKQCKHTLKCAFLAPCRYFLLQCRHKGSYVMPPCLAYNVIFLHFIYYYAESFLLYLLQFIYFMPRRYPILQPFNKK